MARFCAERGVAQSSFYPWKRRLAAAVPPAPPGAFVEAKVRGVDDELRVGVGGTGRVGGIVIELGRDRRVLVSRGFDRVLLLEVMDALESGGAGHATDASPPDASPQNTPHDAASARGCPS